MKIFAATYGDIVKFDRKPNEDFFLVSKKRPIFALADGVTQSHFENKEYAYPAGARAAAEIFCEAVVDYLEKNFRPEKELIKKAFDLANERIWELNKSEGMVEKLDYVVYDYFDTVGVAGFLLNPLRKNKTWERKKNILSPPFQEAFSNGVNKYLFYGYVGDCGLAVFDKENKLKFQTKDMVEPAVEKCRSIYKNWDKMDRNERTKIFHRDFRNKPSCRGYGSFSGEKGVKKYYQINSLTVNPGDLIVFYSDGIVEYLKIPYFIEILRKGDKRVLDNFTIKKARENVEKFGDDRTFIAVSI